MNGGRSGPRDGGGEDDKGLLWKLPAVRSRQLGKLGPAFGVGAGCGLGLGLGLMGASIRMGCRGLGFGPGIPGLQLGFGIGAGCGVGVGFGYGIGRGIAQDDNRRYSNVGNVFHRPGSLPAEDEIGALVDDLIINTKKLISATSREIDKWRR